MLAGYMEAELVAARAAASKMGFIERTGEDVEGYEDVEGTDLGDQDRDKQEIVAEPGLVEELDPGSKFNAWDPTHPSTAFPDFVKAVLRMQASGLNVSYTSLSSDLEGVNYSSIRAGLLDERDEWRVLQTHVVDHVCRRVYTEWIASALLSGRLNLPSLDPANWLQVAWQPRGWAWVDPAKEIIAATKAIDARLTSHSAVLAEQGKTLEEVLEEIDHDRQLAEEYGIALGGAAAPAASGAGGDNGDGTDGGGNGGSNGNGRGAPQHAGHAAGAPHHAGGAGEAVGWLRRRLPPQDRDLE